MNILELKENNKEKEVPVSKLSSLIQRGSDNTKAKTFLELRPVNIQVWSNEIRQPFNPSHAHTSFNPNKKIVGLADVPEKKIAPQEISKKIGSLHKKLNEIKLLKERKDQGFLLNHNQIEKMKKEEEFAKELVKLETEYK